MKGYLPFILTLVIITSSPEGSNGQFGRTQTSTTSKIIRFFGNSYVSYDFNVLTGEMLAPTNTEELSFQFITKKSDGLMWIFNSTEQKLYVAMKDSSLVFGYDDSFNSPQTVRIQHPDSRALNDFEWHTFQIKREGRNLKFFLDDKYVTEFTTRNVLQFVRLGKVFIGGIANPRDFTGRIVGSNFDGAITGVESKKSTGPKTELVISFLQYVDTAQQTGDILIFDSGSWDIARWETTRAPPVTPAPSLPTPVTFTTGASVFYLRDPLDMRSDGSISFKFRTLEPRGLLAFARASAQASSFFAIEIYDGYLYLVYDIDNTKSRKTFSDRKVDDGEWHEVRMEVQNGQLVLTLDRRPFVVKLTRQAAERLYFYRLYIGGFNDYRFNRIPWAIYSREGYKGCLEALEVNGNAVDLHVEIRRSKPQYVEIGCSTVSRSCQTQPCVSGACRDRMNGYVCDCANTPYTGDTCNDDAIIGGWDGSFATTYDFLIRELTHTNDLSFRFRTLMKDTILFRTEADNGRDFIRVELVNGKAQVTISADGRTKTFSSGNDLNDYLWHTLYLRRRANDVELWVDDETPTVGLIEGENYQLQIDRIKFGAVGDVGSLKANNYIGYLQNFMYEDKDLFQMLKNQNSNQNWIIDVPYNKLPLMTYKPVTITTSDAYFQLPSLRMGITMKIMFKFKTRESNGLILYNAGSGRDAIAVELADGQIRLNYNLGGRNMFTEVPGLKKFNDNKWHTVVITLNERGQFILNVDSDTITSTSSDGDGRLDLSGSLYIGGLPTEMFQRSSVTSLITSRNGFRGCLASVDLNGSAPELINYAKDQSTVLNGCTDLNMICQPDVCGTGTCMPGINDYWCNCNMTGYMGSSCTDWPVGYYFGKTGSSGVVLYEFPFERQANSDVDEIAFGFMTREKDGVLYRIESSLNSNEFIEISLDDGFVKAESNTGNGLVSITQNQRRFNDGQYHVVRYVRTSTNSSLQVDTLPAQIIPHTGGASVFNKVYRVILGGRTDDRGAIIRNYYGIMGGAYYNGNRWFDMLLAGKNLHGNFVKLRGDVTLTKPFVLVSGGRPTTAAPPDIVIPPDEVIPEGIGGGGFVVGGISGGEGGPAGVIGIGGPGGSLTPIGGVSVISGPGTPLAVAGVGPAPPALAGGARAGAVVGTLLGTLAFMTSLMWALYKLKPGVPAILSPGAGAAGGGAGMSISAPRATSNLGAVQAASGGAGAGGAGGGASKVTVVNGSAAGGGGAGGGSSTYTSYFQSTATNVQGGGAGGGGSSAMAAGHADAVDSSTLRATGYSSNYQSNAANYQSNTMQSYGGSSMGGGTMDRGYGDRQFMSLSSAGGGDNIPDYDMPMPGTGTLQSQSGHNYSSSTLNTHYNYQVSGTYNPLYSHMTSIQTPPNTHTSVMSLILAGGRNTPTPPHSVVYSAQLAPSRDQGFVDRSEDMVIEVPPPVMIIKPVNVKPNAHYKSEVTIQTGTLPSARYTANSSSQSGETSQNSKFMTLTTSSSGKAQNQQNRKASLQMTSGTRGDFGYERLGSYSSETNIDSAATTGLVSKKNKKQTTNYAESRDDLYESTMTVTSELRSDSVDNSLFSLTEESSGTNDMLFNSVDNFSLFNISSSTPDSRTYSETNQSPSEPTYAKVNKQSNSANKNMTGNSFEMVETDYNVTCTAQLKDQSDLDLTSNVDTLQTTSSEAMSLDNVLNALEAYGTENSSLTLGGSQTDRAEEIIVVQPTQITRRTSGQSQTGNTGNVSFQIVSTENQSNSSIGGTNVNNFTSSVSAMSRQTSERQLNQSETSSSSIIISETYSGAKSRSDKGTDVSGSYLNSKAISSDSSDRKGMPSTELHTSAVSVSIDSSGGQEMVISESQVGAMTMSVDMSKISGTSYSESYSSSKAIPIDSLGRKGSSLEDELDQSVNNLLMGINVDTSQWVALKDRRQSSDNETDVWEVQNYKTVTVNKQGQYVMSTAGGAVTPGAGADEVRVDCCLMTSNGGSVVTGSSLGPPQVWDMQTGELQNIMKGDTVGSTNLHLVCGDRLLVGAVHADMEINEYSSRKGVFNHTLQIWDFQTGRPLSMAEGEYCSAMCPMSDSDKVLFGRTDKFGDATSIIAWDLMGNQMIKEMRYDAPVGNNDYISYLNKSKNDRYIIAGYTNSFDNNAEFMTFDMTLTSYNISEPAMLKLDANPECTAILPKDEAVTGLRNGDLVIWSIRAAQPSRQLMGGGGAHAHSREVKSVTLSEDSRYLVSTSADGTVKVWDMQTERPIHTLQGHSDEVWCSAISSDNEIVVSGSADGTIRLWRMKNGTEMCTFNCGVDIFYVTMSHDKGTIVALGDKYGARKLIMLQVVRTKIKKIVSS